jgi:hypothetical protein
MERCDAIRLEHLSNHSQEEAARNLNVLYRLSPPEQRNYSISEDMATFAFRNANSALRDLQSGTTGEERH